MPRLPILLALACAALLHTAPAVALDGAPKTALATSAPAADDRAEATIRVLAPGGARTLSLAEIERLPMREMPSGLSLDREGVLFEGVLLADLLRAIGAADADEVTLRGADGYAASVPRADWERWPLLLATRAGGMPLSIRARGPARLLYPVHLHPELDERTYINRSVWLLTEIAW